MGRGRAAGLENPEQEKALVISLKVGPWSGAAEEWLALTGREHVEEYYQQYQHGARLIYVRCGGVVSGALLLRIDYLPGAVEGVIVAAGCNVPGVDLVADVLPAVERMFGGVDAIRVHTARPGLVKKLRASGYEAVEVVLKKRVESCTYH